MTFPNDLDGVTIRPATVDDFTSVYELIVQQQIIDFGEEITSSDSLRQRWKSLNLDEDSWIAVGDNDHVLGYAELQYETPTRFFPLIFLDGGEQAEVIATELLQHVEARAETLYTGTASPYLMS